MKTIVTLLGLLALAACSMPATLTPIDLAPYFDGLARGEPVEPATFPWTPPSDDGYPADMETYEIRSTDSTGGGTNFRLPALRREAGIEDEFEAEVLHDEDGVWYEGFYYPGATFISGDWQDGYFESDGYYVPGGVLLGATYLSNPSLADRPYRGHHGARDTGYDEFRAVPRSGQGGDRAGRPARTGPAPGHETPAGRAEPPRRPRETRAEEQPLEDPPRKVKTPRTRPPREREPADPGGRRTKPR